MKEYPLITKKQVRRNKELRQRQKNASKQCANRRGIFTRAGISKMVALKEEKNYFDLSGDVKSSGNSINSSTNHMLEAIEKSGLTGLSGSGFSVAKKIEAVIESKTKEKYLIVNGVECDPGLLHDTWLIKHHLAEIEEGISALGKMIPFQGIFLAAKVISVPYNKKLQLHLVPDRYPIGEERLLIQEVLKKNVAKNEIPADQGILVFNVQTVFAIGEIVNGIYQKGSRYITAADFETGEAVVAKISAGANLIEIIKKTLGERQGKSVFTGGGMMMGHAVENDETADLTTNFVAYGRNVMFTKDTKCKNCGACTRKCPMRIKVHKIIRLLEKDKSADVSLYHPEQCMQCGSCVYYCRAGKNTMKAVVEKGQEVK